MKRIFIVHGLGGTPNGGWRPWLMGELDKDDVYAMALSMPNPEKPSKNKWIEEIEGFVSGNKKDEIYLVGHSLGSTAILRFLEKTNAKNIKGVVLVSGRVVYSDKSKVINFLKPAFDFRKIRSASKQFVVIHGTNDETVPFENAVQLAEQLDCKLVSIKNGGHLNGSSGWRKLPQCLKELKTMMQ